MSSEATSYSSNAIAGNNYEEHHMETEGAFGSAVDAKTVFEKAKTLNFGIITQYSKMMGDNFVWSPGYFAAHIFLEEFIIKKNLQEIKSNASNVIKALEMDLKKRTLVRTETLQEIMDFIVKVGDMQFQDLPQETFSFETMYETAKKVAKNEVLEFGPNVVAMAKKLFEDLMNDFQVTKGSSPVGHGFYMTASFLSNISLKEGLSFANNSAHQLIEILSKEVNDGLLVQTTTLSNILKFMQDVASMDFSNQPCESKDHEQPSRLLYDAIKRGYVLATRYYDAGVQQPAEVDESVERIDDASLPITSQAESQLEEVPMVEQDRMVRLFGVDETEEEYSESNSSDEDSDSVSSEIDSSHSDSTGSEDFPTEE